MRVNTRLVVVFDEQYTLPRQALEVGAMLGYEVSSSAAIPDDDSLLFIAMSSIEARREMMAGADPERLINLVHPHASVSPSAMLGRNVFVGSQAVIGMEARVGDGVSQNALSSIEHDNQIGDFTFLGTGSILCGHVTTGECAFIGGGATIKPGTRGGARTTIGTGAVLIRDADPDSVYIGNPARKLEKN